VSVCVCVHVQMYLMMDALADGGVYAGVPKDLALKLTAYTMMVSNPPGRPAD
jgi:hypothetical protein